MIFIDTNYFLRFLRNDIPEQYDEAKKLFLKASEGKVKLFSSTVVFFEIYWVLDRFYKYDKESIVEGLTGVLNLNNLYFKEKEMLNETINVYKSNNFGLEDSYHLVFAKSNLAKDFKTFDKKLQKHFRSI